MLTTTTLANEGLHQDVFDELDGNGFYAAHRTEESTIRTLFALISTLKPSKIKVDKLYPRKSEAARINTLSSIHGIGRFPPHTDFAIEPLPPNFIVLFCPVERTGKTTLFSAQRLHASVVETGTFRVKTTRRSYSANFSNVSPYGHFYRYNSDIMKPLDRNGLLLSEVIDNAEPDYSVDWSKISWVIVNNWRMLHGREALSSESNANGWLWRLALGVRS